MDRIFLAVMVSGLLLATTSTALLVVSRDGPLVLAAMSPQTAGLRSDELTARQIEEDQFTLSDGRTQRADPLLTPRRCCRGTLRHHPTWLGLEEAHMKSRFAKRHALAAALLIMIGSSVAYAQGGGGGGSGGSSSGGASGGGTSATSGAAGSPAAGSAGAGSLGTSGVPNGPGNAAGLNNSGNDPSGSGNSPAFAPGTTTGLANPSSNSSNAPRANGQLPNTAAPPRGTNSAGTANSSGIGGGGSLRSNGTTMPGNGAATTTNQQDSDAKIDDENRKLDQMVKSICRGC